jgi:hypothetical protein
LLPSVDFSSVADDVDLGSMYVPDLKNLWLETTGKKAVLRRLEQKVEVRIGKE